MIAAMHAQVGELKVDENGLALRGVVVRHLVMPGLLDDTREIMRWIAENMSRDTYVNVITPELTLPVALAVLLVVLVFRPTGLWGQRRVRRV